MCPYLQWMVLLTEMELVRRDLNLCYSWLDWEFEVLPIRRAVTGMSQSL